MNKISILFPRLSGKLSIITHSDASFANLIDTVSSGQGHVVFLADEQQRVAPISWSANKIKRVVSSTLAAKALSLQECLNTAEFIRFILAESMRVESASIPIFAYVDNNDLYKSLHSTSMVSDKKLRIDIASLKQRMSEGNISVTLVESKEMLADCLTKKGADVRKLMSVLQHGRIRRKEE